MLISIIKARSVYHKTNMERAQQITKREPVNSINYAIANDAIISSRAALAELIILQQELNKLKFFQV